LYGSRPDNLGEKQPGSKADIRAANSHVRITVVGRVYPKLVSKNVVEVGNIRLRLREMKRVCDKSTASV